VQPAGCFLCVINLNFWRLPTSIPATGILESMIERKFGPSPGAIKTFGFNAPILIDKSHRFSQGTAVRRQRRQSAVSFGRNHKKRERTAPTPENMFPGSSK
jgi:hypothetical protein